MFSIRDRNPYCFNIRNVLILLVLTISAYSIGLCSPAYAQTSVTVFLADFSDADLRPKMEEAATAVFSAINEAYRQERQPSLDDTYTRSHFRESTGEMWLTAPFYIDESTLILKAALRNDGNYEMRDIPITMLDPEGRDHFEEAVIIFDPEGRLLDIRIALPLHRYNTLLREGDSNIDIERRQNILGFVEKFRTAFNRRDLEFISDVFSDQALIIVGHVVESTGESSPFESQVRFLQFTKEEYLERLGVIFRRNEWIEVTFDDIQIVRHPSLDQIYGLSLIQYYNSSSYSDEGYLFLLVDFRSDENPVIHVRTWQPRHATPETEVFSIGELEIF